MDLNKTVLTLFLIVDIFYCRFTVECLRSFPNNFKFGVSTSAYQIEGAWNSSDKGENIWDYLTHNKPDLVVDSSDGDVACNSYFNIKRDVQMLVELGVDTYRFSLSWSRICPSGFCDETSGDGIKYYNNLIDELIKNNIEPIVTIYHMDLPQNLQLLGGWTNPYLIDYFLQYANIVFENFGDRVKTWLTINEPKEICLLGYGKNFYAPALNLEGIAGYLCTGVILKAHAKAYHLYNSKFRKIQNGRIGLTLSLTWFEPVDDSSESLKAADILFDFENGLYANPIFSQEGNYPKYVIQRIQQRSKEQNFNVSRLRLLDSSDVELLKGSSDFFGLNHYTTRYTKLANKEEIKYFPNPSLDDDHSIIFYQNHSRSESSSFSYKSIPWGFTKLLNKIRIMYNNPEIIVFENGMSDSGEMIDVDRTNYLKDYLNALLDALEDGCRITGYMVWTLMDNFEWLYGYTEPYGLYHVDFSDPDRTRTAKFSAEFYTKVIKDRKI